jgi:hypothetical protein
MIWKDCYEEQSVPQKPHYESTNVALAQWEYRQSHKNGITEYKTWTCVFRSSNLLPEG